MADDFLCQIGGKGMNRAKTYQDGVILYEQMYSFPALKYWLKHNHPKYSEKNPG